MSKISLKNTLAIVLLAAGLPCVLLAQNSTPQPQETPPADQKQDQSIPDAPSAVQPPKTLPESAPEQPGPQDQAPAAPATTEPPPAEPAPETGPNPSEKPPINIQ